MKMLTKAIVIPLLLMVIPSTLCQSTSKSLLYEVSDFFTASDLSVICLPNKYGKWPSTCKPCCYGNQYYNHGQLIATFPSKCMKLYCYLGRIRPVYQGNINECGCCMYNGVMYSNGQSIKGICIRITCQNGQWVYSGAIDWNCKFCMVWHDPFFYTFDNHYYEWHGKCNYSISQKNYGLSESFGIYGQFDSCPWTVWQSCLQYTTFQDNVGTLIQVDHMTAGLPVTVNSVIYTLTTTVQTLPSTNPSLNVLAWKYGSCYFFVGTQGFVLLVCQNILYVWANSGLLNQVNGLCGHFNMIQSDDFTDRWGNVWPLQQFPFAFPNSWLTSHQPRRCSISIPPVPIDPADLSLSNGRLTRASGDPESATNPCRADGKMLESLNTTCKELFSEIQLNGKSPSEASLDIAVASCAATLCTMSQEGTSEEIINEWKERMQAMLETTLQIETMTVDFDGAVTEKPEEMIVA